MMALKIGSGSSLRAAAFAAALLLGVAPLAARADEDADRHAAATEVLQALHSAEMVANILPSLVQQVRLNLTRGDPTLGKQFDGFAPHLLEQAETQKPALLDKLVDVYAKTFTLTELKDMLAYYKSPVGQRIIETQGSVNRDMLAAAREWGNGVAKTMAQDAEAELQGPTKTP